MMQQLFHPKLSVHPRLMQWKILSLFALMGWWLDLRMTLSHFGTLLYLSILLHSLCLLHEPTSLSKAKKDPRWHQAMQEEFQALMDNHTWKLVPPPHHHVIDCKWVYKIKQKADGSLDRYKARLVANGLNQWEGVDYDEIFSSVIKPITIRIILSIATSL